MGPIVRCVNQPTPRANHFFQFLGAKPHPICTNRTRLSPNPKKDIRLHSTIHTHTSTHTITMHILTRAEEEVLFKEMKANALKKCDPIVKGMHACSCANKLQ